MVPPNSKLFWPSLWLRWKITSKHSYNISKSKAFILPDRETSFALLYYAFYSLFCWIGPLLQDPVNSSILSRFSMQTKLITGFYQTFEKFWPTMLRAELVNCTLQKRLIVKLSWLSCFQWFRFSSKYVVQLCVFNANRLQVELCSLNQNFWPI